MEPKEEAAIALLDDVLDDLVRVKNGLEPLEDAIRKAAKARENIVMEAYDMKALESTSPAPDGLSEADRRRYHLIRSLAQLYMGLIKDAGAGDFVSQSRLLRAVSEELLEFEKQGERNGKTAKRESPKAG